MFSTGVVPGSSGTSRKSRIPFFSAPRFALIVSPYAAPRSPSTTRSSSPPTFSSLWRSFFLRTAIRGFAPCPPDQFAEGVVHRIGVLLPPRRGLIRHFPPQPGHVVLQRLRNSFPPGREDPQRNFARDLGEEDAPGFRQRAVRDPREDLADPALLGGHGAQGIEDRPGAAPGDT